MNGVKKYKKKPVIIEAIQITKDNLNDVMKFTEDQCIIAEDISLYESVYGKEKYTHTGYDITINTLEGDMSASIGDYVIKGVKGEFYPCKKNIFEETYEIVNE